MTAYQRCSDYTISLCFLVCSGKCDYWKGGYDDNGSSM